MFRALCSLLVFGAVMGASAPFAHAKPKGLAAFKGKHTGALLVAQGSETRIIGNATFIVSSDKAGKSGRIKLTGSINGTNFAPQVFTLKKGGAASVNFILPGFENFAVPATGTFRASGSKVRISVETGGTGGFSATYTLQYEPGGGISSLSGKVDAGGDPVYITAIGG